MTAIDVKRECLRATLRERDQCADHAEALGFVDLAWALRERTCQKEGLHDYIEGFCGVCGSPKEVTGVAS